MLFTSLDYLLFLPAVALLFHAVPATARLPVVLTASLLFYASYGLGNLLALGAVAAIALGAGRWLLRPEAAFRHAAFWGGTLAILGLMYLLKYHDPVAQALPPIPVTGFAAPPGFSFYAFTAIALLADRYRQPAESRASAGADLLFLAWFPKLLAGPIERIRPFRDELAEVPRLDPALLASAGQLIVWGLVKKVVVADNLAPFVDRTYGIPDYAVPVELILATYFFAFQIYCDFSGYTDIARGSSRLFGIELNENFRRSYFATSIGEFWSRRWHISLSDWFRDFVYYPVVHESTSALRMYAGVMLVFLVSGLWHAGLGYGFGWGFIVWGALNGLWLWGERGLRPWRRRLTRRVKGTWVAPLHGALAALLVFHLVLVSWVFFRAGEIGDALTILSRIGAALPELPALLLRYPFTDEHRFLAALIAGLLLIEAVQERPGLWRRVREAPRALRWAGWYAACFALIVLGRWQGEAFVYMQF
jgi:D-alanyl-lipoteichoic acid acyltransferase DltB (MBOAT superfamily)